MIVPLFDYLNHSPEPNCIAVPYHDKLYNESFIELQAIRDIAKDEQLCISYGDLPNSHLIQKYGFTLADNPQKKLVLNAPFYEYESVSYEEKDLKTKLAKELGIQFVQSGLQNATFYNDKLPLDVLRQLRLSFVTS